MAKLDRDLGNTVVAEVLSVQFLEFDNGGRLLVINQDDTCEDVAFTDGQTVAFRSISATLDPDAPLSEQLDKVPGGAQLTLRGRAVDESSELETVVSVRLAWSYTNACDVEALVDGMDLAWVTFVSRSPHSRWAGRPPPPRCAHFEVLSSRSTTSRPPPGPSFRRWTRTPSDEVEDLETEMAEAAEEGGSAADAIAAADAEC